MKKAFVFPGQGAQFVGMGKDLYENSPEAKELFEKANEILGFRITDLIFSPVAGSGPRIRMLKDISGNIFKFDIGESDIIKLAENLH